MENCIKASRWTQADVAKTSCCGDVHVPSALETRVEGPCAHTQDTCAVNTACAPGRGVLNVLYVLLIALPGAT